MQEIRHAKKEDVPFILNGIKEICKIEKQKPEKKRTLIKYIKLALKNNEIKVVVRDNKAIGFIQFKFTKKNPYGIDYGNYEKKFCWIDWMYVAEKCRGKGIGRTLHNEIRTLCKKNKISEIMLDVFQVNSGAREFYRKEGFSEFVNILKEKID